MIQFPSARSCSILCRAPKVRNESASVHNWNVFSLVPGRTCQTGWVRSWNLLNQPAPSRLRWLYRWKRRAAPPSRPLYARSYVSSPFSIVQNAAQTVLHDLREREREKKISTLSSCTTMFYWSSIQVPTQGKWKRHCSKRTLLSS